MRSGIGIVSLALLLLAAPYLVDQLTAAALEQVFQNCANQIIRERVVDEINMLAGIS